MTPVHPAVHHLNGLSLIQPNWQVPANIHAYCTTRIADNAVSESPYNRFNLALHVEDSEETVLDNRKFLSDRLGLTQKHINWLNQKHTTDCLEFVEPLSVPPVADASWSQDKQLVPVVMTADCLPILVTNHQGSLVAAIHAGWKGTLDGVICESIKQLPEKPENLIVWIGPAISQQHFEVGGEVYQAFHNKSEAYDKAFIDHPVDGDKKLFDLPLAAEIELRSLGVKNISQSRQCSYEQEALFYSYRRDGLTGRMASLIWMD